MSLFQKYNNDAGFHLSAIADDDVPLAVKSKLRVDASDTEPGYLSDKLIAGSNVSFDVIAAGGIKKIRINAAGGSGSGQLPSNVYFVSPAFNDAEPYFESLESLMLFLDNDPPADPVGVVIYSGTYSTTTQVRHPISLTAVGEVKFTGAFNVDAVLYAEGDMYFGNVYLGDTACRLNVSYIGLLEVAYETSSAQVEAYSAGELSCSMGLIDAKIGYVGSVFCLSGKVTLKADRVLNASVESEGWLAIKDAFVGALSNTQSPLRLLSGSRAKIINCCVNGYSYYAAEIESLEIFMSNNSIYLTDGDYSINYSGANVFLRGLNTINRPATGTSTALNQLEGFMLEPDAIEIIW